MTLPAPPQIGDLMPDLSFETTSGPLALRRGPMVLFAYGKDGTPTCTNEIRDFAALAEGFSALGIGLVGLSKDKLASHHRLLAKEGLTIRLASDHGADGMERLGAHGEKLFFGKMVTGVLRKTYLISAEGRLAAMWQVDKVAGHAAQVLAHLRGQA